MSRAYYNEWDKFAAAWLRELIRDGLIMDGDVDDRSICDVQPADLAGYTRCHFFAGIGGWDYALRLAGWPADRPVWTASLPCQPFSSDGKGEGHGDARNLWPVFHRLVRESRPGRIFGEQVEAAIGYGWLDGVFVDLEGLGYACGAAVLPAASVGAPHERHRIYWVADGSRRGLGTDRSASGEAGHVDERGQVDGLADADNPGPQRRVECPGCAGKRTAWESGVPILCRDEKRRRVPIERAFQPLVAGVSPGRVGILRGAGNAIVPQVAAEFVSAAGR